MNRARIIRQGLLPLACNVISGSTPGSCTVLARATTIISDSWLEQIHCHGRWTSAKICVCVRVKYDTKDTQNTSEKAFSGFLCGNDCVGIRTGTNKEH
jgi:hypothetical protein